jgi:hypothetical protein
VKHVPTVLALGALFLGALSLATCSDPEVVRCVVVWTARLTLPLFVLAFVCVGPRARTGIRMSACRAAGFVMALHLLAILRLCHLTGEAPLRFGTAAQTLASIGGAAAAALVVLGWPYGDRGWYHWAQYWPWIVFLFTYVVLSRRGDQDARVFARPLFFAPVVLLLLVALLWRVGADVKRKKGTGTGTGTFIQDNNGK